MIKHQTRSAQPIDAIVGQNLKQFRKAKKLSQSELGDATGISFQQIQKYEKGSNRIGASRLWQFSTLLDVPIQLFYTGLSRQQINADDVSGESPSASQALLTHPQGQALAEAFMNLQNPELEAQVIALCQVLSRSRRYEAA